MLAGYQRQALRRGWPSVVAVDESRTETSPAALTRLLARAGGAKLGYLVGRRPAGAAGREPGVSAGPGWLWGVWSRRRDQAGRRTIRR